MVDLNQSLLNFPRDSLYCKILQSLNKPFLDCKSMILCVSMAETNSYFNLQRLVNIKNTSARNNAFE